MNNHEISTEAIYSIDRKRENYTLFRLVPQNKKKIKKKKHRVTAAAR